MHNIRHIRKRIGWSCPFLAEYIGVDPATLNRWESGRTKPPATAAILFWAIDRSLEMDPNGTKHFLHKNKDLGLGNLLLRAFSVLIASDKPYG